jgi:hypothetical protein
VYWSAGSASWERIFVFLRVKVGFGAGRGFIFLAGSFLLGCFEVGLVGFKVQGGVFWRWSWLKMWGGKEGGGCGWGWPDGGHVIGF